MSTSSNAIFTGSSHFAADFQNVITRAAAIASLPISLLNADKTHLTDQASALGGIDGKFQALRKAVDNIETALSGSSFVADVSDESKVAVTLGAGAIEGNYAIDVADAGTYATSMTASSWLEGTGAVRSYRLSIGGEIYTLSPSGNSAGALASAINSQYGDKVHATVVNVGSGSTPDYRLSLQAVQLGDLKPDLLTGPAVPAPLQTQQTAGSNTRAASRTAQSWNEDPALTFQLSFGGQTYAVDAADHSAQSVAAAIARDYGDLVAANVVNLGTPESPDYRIALEAVKPGGARPDILASDGVSAPVSLQAQQAAGSDTTAVSRTTATWTAASGPGLNYQLSLGGVKYSFTPANNSAATVVSEINSRYGDKVTAALVDLGTATAHDYRITLAAAAPGDLKPDLIAGERSLQSQQSQGALARYMVNNSGLEISSASRSVTIAAGITVNLLAKDAGNPVNITVMRPTSALATALAAFADAYNGAVDELDKQHGNTSSALAGQSVLSQLSSVLSGLATYSPSSGGVSGLAALGLDLDKTGHFKFDSFALIAADIVNSSGVTGFFGSSSTGGFLKAASASLQNAGDSTTGVLGTAQKAIESEIESVESRIGDIQARVDQMTERMQSQMAAMDALISSMEQQYNYLSSMFQAMDTASRQYK